MGAVTRHGDRVTASRHYVTVTLTSHGPSHVGPRGLAALISGVQLNLKDPGRYPKEPVTAEPVNRAGSSRVRAPGRGRSAGRARTVTDFRVCSTRALASLSCQL
jgi:hypothetical protein